MYSPSRSFPSASALNLVWEQTLLPAPRHKARVKRIYAGDIKAAAGRERRGGGSTGVLLGRAEAGAVLPQHP